MQAIKELLKQLAGIWNELGLNQKVTVMASGLAAVAGSVSYTHLTLPTKA